MPEEIVPTVGSLFSGVPSEAWTWDSPAPGSGTRSSASGTSGDAGSSPATGPGSPSGTTSVLSLSENQRGELMLTPYARQITGGGGKPGQGYPAVLISSQEGSPAKTSQSPDAAAASTGNAADCSSSSPESLTLWSHQEDGSSLRTFPDFFPLSPAGISGSFSRRWPTSGSWTGPGECWTHDSSESPSAGGASSSLPDVLEGTVHERYFLSRRAAAGILRRATRRGRVLPAELEAALRELAS